MVDPGRNFARRLDIELWRTGVRCAAAELAEVFGFWFSIVRPVRQSRLQMGSKGERSGCVDAEWE